jgi:hypothetical protein
MPTEIAGVDNEDLAWCSCLQAALECCDAWLQIYVSYGQGAREL